MKYRVLLLISLLFLSMQGCSSAAIDQHYKNLENPAEYLFSTSEGKITEILRDPQNRLPPPKPLYGAFHPSGIFGFEVMDYYTRRYWTGIEERSQDVDPPEAGRIGTISASFEVHLTPHGENRTLVSVSVKQFTQQVGRHYDIFPHFHKTGTIVTVKSDTYFEYLFLRKLGELLGEKNMPPIKGSD